MLNDAYRNSNIRQGGRDQREAAEAPSESSMEQLTKDLQQLELGRSSQARSSGSLHGGNQQHSNLYVNNLPPNTIEAELSALFAPYGTVESLRLVRSPGRLGGTKSFAFVKMTSMQQAVAAIRGLNNAQIGRNSLEVKFADADAGDRNPELSAPPSDNLYCKNLPGSYSEDDLRSLFMAYGSVIECRVLHKGDTQGSGALVRMGTVEEAMRAVQHLHNQRLPGSAAPLVVRYADSAEQKAKRQARQQRQAERAYAAAGMAGAYVPHLALGSTGELQGAMLMHPAHTALGMGVVTSSGFVYGASEAPYGMQMQQMGVSGPGSLPDLGLAAGAGPSGSGGAGYSAPGSACSVYVKHLPEEADKLFLYEKFAPFGCVLSVKVMMDEHTGKCKGVGFVNYAEAESANRAVQGMNGMPMGERRLYVAIQTQRSSR